MNLMNAFKKKIYKEDLLHVLGQAFFISIVLGLLTGSIKLLFEESFGMTLSLIFSVVIALYITKRIKASYQTYHIIYSIISVVAFVLAFYLMNITYFVGFFFIRSIDVFSIEALLFIMKPINTFYFLDPFSGYFFNLEVILELIFFLIGAVYAFINSK